MGVQSKFWSLLMWTTNNQNHVSQSSETTLVLIQHAKTWDRRNANPSQDHFTRNGLEDKEVKTCWSSKAAIWKFGKSQHKHWLLWKPEQIYKGCWTSSRKRQQVSRNSNGACNLACVTSFILPLLARKHLENEPSILFYFSSSFFSLTILHCIQLFLSHWSSP